jgi:hypothetical protein
MNNKTKESRTKDIDPQLKQELTEHFETALNMYKSKLDAITRVIEQDELIKTLYDHKLDAINNFNKILNNHQEAFSQTNNLNSYNSTRKLLEMEIDKLESKQLDQNILKSDQLCQKLLNDSYTPVKFLCNPRLGKKSTQATMELKPQKITSKITKSIKMPINLVF